MPRQSTTQRQKNWGFVAKNAFRDKTHPRQNSARDKTLAARASRHAARAAVLCFQLIASAIIETATADHGVSRCVGLVSRRSHSEAKMLRHAHFLLQVIEQCDGRRNLGFLASRFRWDFALDR
jgi:hypothetical protein